MKKTATTKSATVLATTLLLTHHGATAMLHDAEIDHDMGGAANL